MDAFGVTKFGNFMTRVSRNQPKQVTKCNWPCVHLYVPRYHPKHTCSAEDKQKVQPQATAILFGESVKHKFIDPSIVNEVGNEKLAHCFFKTPRYTIMTSNNAESLNALTVKARSFPIMKCLDWLRERM